MLCQLKCWMKFFLCPVYSWIFFKSTHVLCNNTVMYLLIMYRCFCYNQTITSSIQYCLWFFDIHCMIIFLILTWYYWLERLFDTFDTFYCILLNNYHVSIHMNLYNFFFGGGGNLGVQFVVFLCLLIKYWIIKSRMNLLAAKVILI